MGMLLQLALEVTAGRFYGAGEGIQVFAAGRILVGGSESDPGLFGQTHQRFAESQVFRFHQERERVPGLPATKALVVAGI